MSFCTVKGKDKVIFVTKEDHQSPSTVMLPEDTEDDEPAGSVLPNGEINWSCPCMGGMPLGPCGVQFREAFTCYHFSEADPKGSDCYETFEKMHECMSKYPSLYKRRDDREDEDEGLGVQGNAIKEVSGASPGEINGTPTDMDLKKHLRSETKSPD